MARAPYPMPDLVPLTRLHVSDSLRVNADRWSVAHDYHRQRQNLHYQSLWQPGIVHGLGVKLIAPPEVAHSQFKEAYWVEVQPGLAIDGEGNPIVVEPEPIANRVYPLVFPRPLQSDGVLYIVVRYVDPNTLAIEPDTDRSPERFRFDQRIDALEPQDIELCRIQLRRGEARIEEPPNPLVPQDHQLDFRYRPQAQVRSRSWLSVGTVTQLSQHTVRSFETLIQAIPGLYAQMQVSFDAAPLSLATPEQWAATHLIYCQASAIAPAEGAQQSNRISALREYLKGGGVLLVEAEHRSVEWLSSLEFLKRDLHLQPVAADHLLRRCPFFFNAWPQPVDHSIELLWDDGLLVVIGSLVDLWSHPQLSRTDVREAHEWGLNLLHYAWQHHHFYQLLR
ncbi:hypothetical protein PN498_10945 [Oscillatoria sp. CS-180]|uniref:hypothetical protein n=1 Tax=Oscillatoria sp. CS-180 TaxID=3021720 RepID=UPI0023311C5E|nr:hypothetical protein [Oscillatoria sp. CS-180]MDB9526507.1 hypothetical protein [Oscillatoria sp. CS-180]